MNMILSVSVVVLNFYSVTGFTINVYKTIVIQLGYKGTPGSQIDVFTHWNGHTSLLN